MDNTLEQVLQKYKKHYDRCEARWTLKGNLEVVKMRDYYWEQVKRIEALINQ